MDCANYFSTYMNCMSTIHIATFFLQKWCHRFIDFFIKKKHDIYGVIYCSLLSGYSLRKPEQNVKISNKARKREMYGKREITKKERNNLEYLVCFISHPKNLNNEFLLQEECLTFMNKFMFCLILHKKWTRRSFQLLGKSRYSFD